MNSLYFLSQTIVTLDKHSTKHIIRSWIQRIKIVFVLIIIIIINIRFRDIQITYTQKETSKSCNLLKHFICWNVMRKTWIWLQWLYWYSSRAQKLMSADSYYKFWWLFAHKKLLNFVKEVEPNNKQLFFSHLYTLIATILSITYFCLRMLLN